MADTTGTVATLATELARVFEPLEARLAAGEIETLFAELGLQLPAALDAQPEFASALTEGATAIAALPPLVQQLAAAVQADDVSQVIDAVAQLIDAIAHLLDAIDKLATALSNVAGAIAGANAADVGAFAATLAESLVDYLVVSYLEDYYPRLRSVFSLFGIVEITPQNAASVDPAKPPYYQRRLHLDRISDLLQSPETFLRMEYGWGDPGFDGHLLLQRIRDVFFAFAVPALAVPAHGVTPESLRVLLFSLRPKNTLAPPGLELAMELSLADGLNVQFPFFFDGWSIEIAGTGKLDAGLAVDITPPGTLTLTPPTGELTGELWLRLIGAPVAPATSFLLFGSPGAVRAEVAKITAGVGAGFEWNAGAGHAAGELQLDAKIERGKIVIQAGQSDGFVSTLLPSDGISVNFDFDLGWSSSHGVRFSGGAGIETTIAIGVSIGPLNIESLHIGVSLSTAGMLTLEASVSADGTLGPISASIDRIGIEADLAFKRGNLGPVDLGVAFKPPTGLGIDIDAGPISGGGFISFDPPTGRYAGVLALSLYGISITAIGLLDTKLPGGQSGFSFLIIISVEFTGIQLGFGFTLNGVGGLCGINRTMVTDAIQSGLRHHALDAILFPPDPVKNAPQIISTLSTIYPPAEGRYVFGPILKIGWGTPSLITAEIGVLIEVPSPIVLAILGQLAMELPTHDAPVAVFHVDVLGIIDFGQKVFSIDATIHDSRIVIFTITGDMAMRLTWGDDPSFLFSVGGFNPHYPAPPSFPALQRLTVALEMDVVRLTLQAYLAVTSNSFQLGAHLEIYIGVSSFNIYGWLGFDALIIFSPFSFIVDFTAGLALRSGTSTIMGISVAGSLSGPTPWHVEGEAHFSILFFDIGVHVSATIGNAQANPRPAINAWTPLLAAIQAQGNWNGALPAGAPQVVTLAPPERSAAPVLIDPAGTLTFRQKVVPLDQAITKFGEATPDQQAEFDLTAVTLGGTNTAFSSVDDEFAPGQFRQLSDGDKLSLPSFEPMVSGFAVSDGAVDFGKQYDVDIVIETVIVDSPKKSRLAPNYALLRGHVVAMSRAGAAARGALFTTGIHGSDPAPGAQQLVAIDAEQYVVAGVDAMDARTDISGPASKGAVYAALAAHLAANPADDGRLQVIPMYELPVAA